MNDQVSLSQLDPRGGQSASTDTARAAVGRPRPVLLSSGPAASPRADVRSEVGTRMLASERDRETVLRLIKRRFSQNLLTKDEFDELADVVCQAHSNEDLDSIRGSLELQVSGYAAIRASHQERASIARQLQEALADGRIDDDEFEDRMLSVLRARTIAELVRLTADLPADLEDGPGWSAGPAMPGRFKLAVQRSVRFERRWCVPARLNLILVNSRGLVDLRAAHCAAGMTTLRVAAVGSQLSIVVPLNAWVRPEGPQFAEIRAADREWEDDLPPDAAVIRIRAFTRKSIVKIYTRPPTRRYPGCEWYAGPLGHDGQRSLKNSTSAR